jgi:hypothetical protein
MSGSPSGGERRASERDLGEEPLGADYGRTKSAT